jgi:hypothetical protein
MAVSNTVSLKTYYPSIQLQQELGGDLQLWRMQGFVNGDSSGGQILTFFDLDPSENSRHFVITDVRIFQNSDSSSGAQISVMRNDWVRYSIVGDVDVTVAAAPSVELGGLGTSVFPFGNDQMPINLGKSQADGSVMVSVDNNHNTVAYLFSLVGVESRRPITLPSSLELRSLI